MHDDELRIEHIVPDLDRRRGLGPRAGVFLLAGRYEVVERFGLSERRLRARGALLVADLVFDPGEAERDVAGGTAGPRPPRLAPLPVREAAGRPPVPTRN